LGTSSSNASYKKGQVKEIDPNKRSKTLITFKGQVRREKLKGKPKGNQVEQRPYKSQLKNKMVKKI
jgi:hypothetical protein